MMTVTTVPSTRSYDTLASGSAMQRAAVSRLGGQPPRVRGLRLGASADATSRGSSAGNAAHLGLDLLTPLALALGAAEVETRAKAATRVRDLAREGRVSCAAAAKSGAVAALVALATHFADASFLRGGAAETDRSATGSARVSRLEMRLRETKHEEPSGRARATPRTRSPRSP